MSINVKKYTKGQMAKMVEDAQEAAKKTNGCMNELRSRNSELELQVRTLKAKNAALTEQIDQMNGEAINKDNEIEKLKAYFDSAKNSAQCLNDQGQQYWRAWQASKREVADLKNKLNDTEAALERANAEVAELKAGRAQQTKEIFEWQGSAQALHDDLLNARERADYAEAHPWRNLWAWIKRKLVRHE